MAAPADGREAHAGSERRGPAWQFRFWAMEEAPPVRAVGVGAARETTATLSARHGVPQALIHHGLYGRGALARLAAAHVCVVGVGGVGSLRPMPPVDGTRQAVRAVANGPTTVAVLQLPCDDESWRAALLSDQPDRLRVFMRLPFVGVDGAEWSVIERLWDEGRLPALRARVRARQCK